MNRELEATPHPETWRSTAIQALRKCGAQVANEASERLGIVLQNRRAIHAEVWADGNWLMLEGEPLRRGRRGALDADRLWQLMSWNRELGGGARFALSAGRVRVRADLPLDATADLPSRLPAACAGLKEAFERFWGESAPEAAPRGTRVAAGPVEPSSVQRLCGDSGWPCHDRTDGSVGVDLEVRGEYRQAVAEETNPGDIRVHTEFFTAQRSALSTGSRLALAVLCLSATEIVRMVRAVTEPAGDEVSVRLEVGFQGLEPSPGELAHAFSALSVICEICGKEVVVLGNEELAGHYLALMEGRREQAD